MFALAASIRLPQLGSGASMPMPRKLSELSARIVPASSTIDTASRTPIICGSTWRVTTYGVDPPIARAACTNSRCRSEATCVRTSLAIPGQAVIASATITGTIPRRQTPMIRIASRMSGKANIPSVSRIKGLETQRGAYTPITPTAVPITSAKPCTIRPTVSDTRAP